MAAQQKPRIDIAGLNRDLVIPGLACRHCMHFLKEGLYEDERDRDRERTPCKNLNVLPTSKPCPNFSVEPAEFNFGDVEDPTELLSKLLVGLDEKRLPQFAAHLVEMYKTRKKGYRFGEIVYIRLFGDDYLSNYFAVRVVKVKEVIEKMYQTSSLDPQIGKQMVRARRLVVYLQGRGNLRLRLYDNSVMREREMVAKRKELQSKGRLVDPRYDAHTHLPLPDTLDDPAYLPPLAAVAKHTKKSRQTIKTSAKPSTGTLSAGRQRRHYENRRFPHLNASEGSAFRVSGKGLAG